MRAFVFTDKALGRQAGRFVWLSINTEKRENAAVLAKYPFQASPTLFVIDPVAEKVVLKYVGGATVTQLQRILDDGARAAAHGRHGRDGRKPDEWLAKADAFYSAGRNKEAAEAYRIASVSYGLGGSSALDLLDAKRTMLEAKSQYTDALGAANDALADLERAAGAPLPAPSGDSHDQ